MSASYRSHLHDIIAGSEADHFWFKSRLNLIRKVVSRYLAGNGDKRFLEVGCGNGEVIRLLESMDLRVTGIDVNRQAIEHAAVGTHATLIQQSFLSYHATEAYDAIGIFDVLEHQSNDKAFLKKCVSLLAPGGYIFITVPAKMSLWSDVDAVSGHKRRYELSEFPPLFDTVGLEMVFINYWQCAAYPIYKFWKKINHTQNRDDMSGFFRTPPKLFNWLLYKLLTLERLLLLSIQLPFGSSIITVARKSYFKSD